MSRWDALTERLLTELRQCDPIYSPTSFWGPGIETLLTDLRVHGLEQFKSWPSAGLWFYPTYGPGFAPGMVTAIYETAQRVQPAVQRPWLSASLLGGHQARRDYDAVRLAWDLARWPFDIGGLAESEAGVPPQAFRFSPTSAGVSTRAYLNYLLCLAALSQHVEAAPHRFLEVGGGYGVLGEIVLSRDPDARYVNLDLPPLLTVASFYLDRLFGERVATYEALGDDGALPAGSACLPNWRITDLAGPFDVFFNSHSFQEMEPDVVDRYAEDVARLGVTWVVSMNSRGGKDVRTEDNPVGVTTPVRSADIRSMFEARGYRTVATYGEPLIQSNAEIAILRLVGAPSPSATRPPASDAGGVADAGEAAADGAGGERATEGGRTVDLRRSLPPPSAQDIAAARRMLRPGSPVGPVRRTMRRVVRGTRRVGNLGRRRPPAG